MTTSHKYRLLLPLALLGAGGAASCAAPPDPSAPSAQAVEAGGRAYAARLDVLGAGARPDGGAAVDLQLGYMERLRLGLGSPFRLIEQALADERLDAGERRGLAAALLSRTAAGDAYDVEAGALDALRAPASPDSQHVGAAHLRLITDAIEEATDARAGELALRLGYMLAHAEWVVDPVGERLAIQAGGLVRDRVLARRDARRLLAAAEARGVDPLALVHPWRAERRFEVEQPPLMAVGAEGERYAMRLGPRLAEAIRQINAKTSPRGGPAAFRQEAKPVLRASAARRLLQRSDSVAGPPQAPVAVVVGAIARSSTGAPSSPDPAAGVLASLTDEERFAAGYALLAGERPELQPFMARAAIWVATALRPYGQEIVERTDEGAPTSRELADEFGLASVEFDPGVPAGWRPHYRRMLRQALQDLQRVLPALDMRGLTIRVGAAPAVGALAMHDPKARVVYFPPGSGAGTLAHEIAHDLDWQVALRRYHVRGDYGSDRSVRIGSGRLAATYQGLTGAVLVSATPVAVELSAHQTRPAEIFARSVDWYVAASLAREGRIDGYLSSVQDELLTGYGTVVAPDMTGRAGAALVSLLDEVAPLHASDRDWFIRTYGPGRVHTATDLVRQVTQVGDVRREGGPDLAGADSARLVEAAQGALAEPLARLEATRDEAIRTPVCTAPGAALDPSLAAERRTLIETAAAARARGLAKRYAARMLGRPGVGWVSARFGPGPWPAPADTARLTVVETLVEEARQFGAPEEAESTSWFQLWQHDDDCAPQLLVGLG